MDEEGSSVRGTRFMWRMGSEQERCVGGSQQEGAKCRSAFGIVVWGEPLRCGWGSQTGEANTFVCGWIGKPRRVYGTSRTGKKV